MRHLLVREVSLTPDAVVPLLQDWRRWLGAAGARVGMVGSTYVLHFGGPCPFSVRVTERLLPEGVELSLVEGDVAAFELRAVGEAADGGAAVTLALTWQPNVHVPGVFERTVDQDILPQLLEWALSEQG